VDVPLLQARPLSPLAGGTESQWLAARITRHRLANQRPRPRSGSVRHIAAFGNAVLEIIPLRRCIGPNCAARPLSRVGLDRQRATLLRKLRADWAGGLRAIRRRGFSQHGGCGKEQRDEHCKNRGSRGVHRCHFQPSSLNCRDGGARPPAIAYSRVDTGPIPSAVRSSSNLPASHSRLGHGLIAQSC